MQEMGIFKLIIFAFLIFLYLLAIFLGYILYRQVQKRSVVKGLKWLGLIPLLLVGFFTYKLLVIPDSFYKALLPHYAGYDFPEEGELLYTYASASDEFGDATYQFYAKIGSSNCADLLLSAQDKGFVEEKQANLMVDYPLIVNQFPTLIPSSTYIYQELGHSITTLIFISDNQSILFEVIQY